MYFFILLTFSFPFSREKGGKCSHILCNPVRKVKKIYFPSQLEQDCNKWNRAITSTAEKHLSCIWKGLHLQSAHQACFITCKSGIYAYWFHLYLPRPPNNIAHVFILPFDPILEWSEGWRVLKVSRLKWKDGSMRVAGCWIQNIASYPIFRPNSLLILGY